MNSGMYNPGMMGGAGFMNPGMAMNPYQSNQGGWANPYQYAVQQNQNLDVAQRALFDDQARMSSMMGMGGMSPMGQSYSPGFGQYGVPSNTFGGGGFLTTGMF
jgi:hypothetical protein